MSTNAIATWDFTVNEEHIKFDDLKNNLKEACKKWVFQKEKGETGYTHYQGRVSLKVKSRTPSKLFQCNKIHWSPTNKKSTEDDFYVTKTDTRIDGPWSSEDKEIYIPRQIREITKLYPWQQYIVDNCNVWDKRTINLLVDTNGNNGKSTLKGYLRSYDLARPLPFVNDYRDVMRMVCDMPTSKCYIIDIPRAIKKDHLFQFFASIESIKDGYAYDDRYTFKEKVFDCPNIWIFTNSIPEKEYLSQDRWRYWKIVNNELTEFEGATL